MFKVKIKFLLIAISSEIQCFFRIDNTRNYLIEVFPKERLLKPVFLNGRFLCKLEYQAIIWASMLLAKLFSKCYRKSWQLLDVSGKHEKQN